MTITARTHGAHYVRRLSSEVTTCWRTASRRGRQQTLFTLGVVAILVTLILAGLLG